MSIQRKWFARWIRGNGNDSIVGGVPPAPYLRTVFDLSDTFNDPKLYLAAPGWHVLYINGYKADDRVLSPTVTQFDKHVSYVVYDLKALLHSGRNAIVVLLGNGWYNCHTQDEWLFHHAPWRDTPKLLCELEIDGKLVVCSDDHWKTASSPIIFDALRNGEIYDSRLEIPNFADPEFDDSSWQTATLCNSPGGELIQEELEPCRIIKRYTVFNKITIDNENTLYDFGTNLTGWCEVTAEGPMGSEIKLVYTEQITDDNLPDCEKIAMYIKSGDCQTDRFILNGNGYETFNANFTYHGFRYVSLHCPAEVIIHNIEACFVHNSFSQVGEFKSSNPILNRLQEITLQSYLSNFTGIPTDCPHREKNGWTGDAQLALETGLWNYDGRLAYEHFLRMLVDTQRPSGQFPGIVPTGGWGYNWGSGPAWDSLLFEIIDKLWLFYHDDTTMRTYYDAMKRYIDYCLSHADKNKLIDFGLGDWCIVEGMKATPVEVTSSGYFYSDVRRLSLFADHLGYCDDAKYYDELAQTIRDSFNRKFRHKNGDYADGAVTALGTALYFKICSGVEAEVTAKLLVERIRQNNHKAAFGILGAKYIPRVLADYGYAEDAYRLLTQPAYPGWGYWVVSGATTLQENWDGCSSLNHIMFGDVSAWMYQYLGGITPLAQTPGFEHFVIEPRFIAELESVQTQFRSIHGIIRSNWYRQEGKIICDFEIPLDTTADLILPDKTLIRVSGRQRVII